SEGAYVYKATLKVMLEEDYLESHKSQVTSHNDYSFKDPRSKVLNEYSSQLIREKIIPQLTKRINTSKDYAPLRQVYYSLILAQWFKARHTSLASVIVRKPPKAADESIQNLINSHNLSNLQSKT
ncbi:MAG: hypothetical protein NTY47_00440, partial [Candidatus Omnitrophica bacterium]|nr:hypothetical protein [Candidatus Omnitrophota bacterium]